MTDFEQLLTDRLHQRADGTSVTITAESIKNNQPPRLRSGASSAPWRPVLSVAAVAVVVVVGLVAFSSWRSENPAPAAIPATVPDPYRLLPRTGPTVDEHWHIAYGIDLCGTWTQLAGDLEDRDQQGQLANDEYLATGIHSHDDGLIHLHPFTAAGAGPNATLGQFFANYGIELTDTGLAFQPDADNGELRSAYEACTATSRPPVVTVWPDVDKPDESIKVTHGFAGIPLGADGMAIAVTFADEPTPTRLPPSAEALEHLTPTSGTEVSGGIINSEDRDS